MNKKAISIVMTNLVYLILLVIVTMGMLFYIQSKQNNASIWAEYYVEELSKLVNFAKPGDIITFDVHKATEIAYKKQVSSRSEIFSFDNPNNEICVKLSVGRKTCYSYFNNVDVISKGIALGPPNTLTIEITKTQDE